MTKNFFSILLQNNDDSCWTQLRWVFSRLVLQGGKTCWTWMGAAYAWGLENQAQMTINHNREGSDVYQGITK